MNMGKTSYEQTVYPLQPPHYTKGTPDFFISCFGVFKSKGRFIFEQISPRICFHIIQSGAGVMEGDGIPYNVKQGELFIFWPGMHIRYYDFPETPWRYTWFVLDGDRKMEILEMTGLSRKNPHLDISHCTDFLSTLSEVSGNFTGENQSVFYPVKTAWALLDALSSGLKTPDIRKHDFNLADACRKIIDNQLTEIPNVDELSELFNVNRTTLFRAFKNRFKLSPKEYIDNLRLEKAAELLLKTRLSIKEVAHACGFKEQYYFSNVFSRRFKLPPSKWRVKNNPSL